MVYKLLNITIIDIGENNFSIEEMAFFKNNKNIPNIINIDQYAANILSLKRNKEDTPRTYRHKRCTLNIFLFSLPSIMIINEHTQFFYRGMKCFGIRAK